MKALLIYTSIFCTLFMFSCKKETSYSNEIQPGVWYSADPLLQIPIHNTKGEGNGIKVLDYRENNKRFLKVTHLEGEDLYLIIHVGKKELVLSNSKDSLNRNIFLSKVD